MLIKEKDKNQEQVDYLTELLERDIPDDKKRFVERELKCLYSGDKGEKTTAYYLDFEFKDAKNWALIHDLRIEHKGHVAQIDHLLIGRMMEIYVIESKNFASGVVISDEGDFSYFYNNKPYPIPSPIAQNQRHIKLLNRYLTDNDLLPKRLGVSLKPNYRNIVLISPTSRLTKPKKGLYDCSAVMKSDKFISHFDKDVEASDLNSLIGLTKVISSDSLRSFGEKLAYLHEPLKSDYSVKFNIDDNELSVEQKTDAPACPQCGVAMVKRSVKSGKNIGKEFWGCSTYPKCKGVLNLNDDELVEEKPELADVPDCPKCHKPMVERFSKKADSTGKAFWGCSDFPKCKGTLKKEEPGIIEPAPVVEVQTETPLCPKCGEPMVRRSAKKGKTSGKEFWGCSAFPKCRGIISID